MSVNMYDLVAIIAYFIVLLAVGIVKGRGKRKDSGDYFISKGTLPWWVIAAAFVATGMNTEQLIGQNGMGYSIGLTMINWYMIAIFVYSLLIFVFLPIYLRNGIVTLPEYLERRYNRHCRDIFAVILLLSYVLLNLAVVFYGGAKLLEIVMGLNIWYGVIIIGLVAGIYTMYGGMASASYAAVFQFLLIYVSGFVIFALAYIRLPNGWSDVVAAAPGGFHIMQPMDYPVIPWHAIPLTILGLHLYYSCVNQALVQRSFGAKTEWDARMAIIVSGFFVILRPFVEILPGMICRALGTFDPVFNLDNQPVDNVFPILIKELIPAGFRGLVLVGILSSVMSTIAAFLNSISTLFTLDIYKKWIRKDATEKQLVKVGTYAILALMLFSVAYSPFIGVIGGGIFNYFQMLASYIADPECSQKTVTVTLKGKTGVEQEIIFELHGGANAGKTLTRQVSITSGVGVNDVSPSVSTLAQNIPNPFNPTTSIPFTLSRGSQLSLEVYNIAGEKVAKLAEGPFVAGEYSFNWDASGHASGVYFYQFAAGDIVETRKMLLLK